METVSTTLSNGNILTSEELDRTTYIGASDNAPIMGKSKYRTPLDVYNAKVNPQPKQDKIVFRFGKHFESFVLDEYAREYNVSLVTSLYVKSVKNPFLAAQLDALYYEDDGIVIVDAKTVNPYRYAEFGEPGTCEIPLDIKHQVAVQAHLTNAKRVDIPVLFYPSEVKVYVYERDLRFEEEIIQESINFWRYNVEPKLPPAPINDEDIKSLYPESNGTEIEVDFTALELVERINFLKNNKKEIEDKIDPLEFELKKIIGPYDKALYAGEKIASFKEQSRWSTDEKNFKKEEPDAFLIYEKYKKQSFFRVLRTK